MPEIDINVEVYCLCGAGLCNQTEATRTRSRREACFIVTPCEKCTDIEREEARKEGYDEGYSDGQEAALKLGEGK